MTLTIFLNQSRVERLSYLSLSRSCTIISLSLHSSLFSVHIFIMYPLLLSSCWFYMSVQMAWKCLSGGDAHTTTLSILSTLSSYPWDAKLVISLAAFSMSYGEFWLLAQSYTSNQLAKSVAVLKQLPDILERSSMLKPQFEAIRNLIKVMLDITKCIVEFKELPSRYISSDVTALSTATAHIPIAVYWTIRSTVASASQITGLIGLGHQYVFNVLDILILGTRFPCNPSLFCTVLCLPEPFQVINSKSDHKIAAVENKANFNN